MGPKRSWSADWLRQRREERAKVVKSRVLAKKSGISPFTLEEVELCVHLAPKDKCFKCRLSKSENEIPPF